MLLRNILTRAACTAVLTVFLAVLVEAQYDDVRCKCVCPDPSVVNVTGTSRKLYIGNVPPSGCNCDQVVMPHLQSVKAQDFCFRCECKYESRNTTTIKIVVIIIIWIISLLVIYMLFLMCLDPLLNKRTAAATMSYQQHTNDDLSLEEAPQAGRQLSVDGETPEGGPSPMGFGSLPLGAASAVSRRPVTGSSVINRVGHQQYKWKRQVQEQRRNIYDKHTMLN